ncbi:hypothetical protein PIB30_050963 [Stylosanthes scabra]|uniref:Uncharacterized protein n=1 Tax=Stylosanthes scabra TaxID=79078 RepID=A0ABU6XI05_9FABA|nr:hypothetical protein [Stylosanthes scabra]
MRESWWRIGTRTGSYQFFRRSHQLLVAITFDPELRLTHGLRLRKVLVVLFASIIHATDMSKYWRNGGRYDVIGVEDGRLVLGYLMMRRKSRVIIELGVQGFHEMGIA